MRTRSSNAVCHPPSSVLIITTTRVNVKLPAHRAGLAGHLPVKVQSWESLENGKNELWAKGNVGKKHV